MEVDASLGFYSNCPGLGGGPIDLETCKIHARQQAANVFNYRDNECHYKSCEDISDLQTTTIYGGWDVYVDRCGECILSSG